MSFEFSPVKLVYGGEALGFHAGRTVLTPRILPGERAEVEEIRQQKSVVHARPLRILEPSPERIEPPCRYFGHCGGCQYQHFPHTAQITAKVEILRETLRRLGHVKWEGAIPAHSGPAWNYRNQAQLKVGMGSEGSPALGFFEAESNRLISIDACPILSPRLNMLLAVLRSEPWISLLGKGRQVELLADDRDERVMLILDGGWDAEEAESLGQKCLAELAGVSTVAVTATARAEHSNASPGPKAARGQRDFGASATVRPRNSSDLTAKMLIPRQLASLGSSLYVFGDLHLTYRIGEFAYRVSPTSFFQRSRFLLPEFVTAVAGPVIGGTRAENAAPGVGPAHAGPSPRSGPALRAGTMSAEISGAVAIDLYAGVGLFSLPLAMRFERVIAVEAHPQAAADLAANAGLVPGNRIRAIAGTVFDFLRRCAQMEPDLVVMDPPRAGLGVATLKLLLALRPKRIHYASCSPPTLARDVGFLLNHDYQLEGLELFDFFPQTYHIESFARLSPNS